MVTHKLVGPGIVVIFTEDIKIPLLGNVLRFCRTNGLLPETKEQMFDSLIKCAMTLSEYHLVQFMGALGNHFDASMFMQMRFVEGKSKKEALMLTLQRIHEEAQKLP